MAQQIKEFISTILQPNKNWKIKLLSEWHTIMGSLHTKVRIEKIQDNILILGVFNSSWMQELYLLSPILLKTINENLDEPYIKQLRFKYVSRTAVKTEKSPIKRTVKTRTALTEKDMIPLSKITNQELRDALKAFRIRCYEE